MWTDGMGSYLPLTSFKNLSGNSPVGFLRRHFVLFQMVGPSAVQGLLRFSKHLPLQG